MRAINLVVISIILLFSFGQSSQAQARFCQGSSPAGGKDYKSHIQKVAAYGKDSRRTVEEYAQDTGQPVSAIKRRFAATGTITCRHHVPCVDHPDKTCDQIRDGSAQLTLKADVITTSAHLFADEDSCKIIVPAHECTFTIEGPSQTYSIQVDKLLNVGDPAGGSNGHCPAKEVSREDWAIVKLRQSAIGVIPYTVDLEGSRLKKNESVMLVCHSLDFVRKDSKGNTITPKTIESCSVRDTQYIYERDLIQTDCAEAPACSGGGLLSETDGRLILRAVFRSSYESQKEAEHAAAVGQIDDRPYNSFNWTNQFVPVTRDFLNALRNLEGLPPLDFPKTVWDQQPLAPADLGSSGRVKSFEELGVKRVMP